MTEFEIASAKYHKAKDAYCKTVSALDAARHQLTLAERERSAAFRKEVEAARLRASISRPNRASQEG
jgi:hypothetical protein